MSDVPFVPKPGQIDFTHARFAPVIYCVVLYQDTILVLKRSVDVGYGPGEWAGVSGFLDDNKTLEEKVVEEIQEELNVGREHIRSIEKGGVFADDDSKYDKTWIIFPVKVVLDTNVISTDWESTTFKWLTIEKLMQHDISIYYRQVLNIFFK